MIKELDTFRHLLNTVPGFKAIMELSDKDINAIKETTEVRDDMYFKKVPMFTNNEVYVNSNGTIVLVDGVPRSITNVLTNPACKSIRTQCHVLKKNYYVHRLVAMAFVSNPKPISFKLVCHVNGKSDDNFYKNLVWGNTRTYTDLNVKNYPHLHDTDFRTDDSLGTCKLNKTARHDIAARLNEGELAKALSKEYNVSDMTITRIRQKYCAIKVASPKYDRKTKKIIAQLFKDDNHSDKTIATITGIRYETIWRWRKKWKVGNFPEDITVGLNGQKLKTGKRRSKMHHQPKLVY